MHRVSCVVCPCRVVSCNSKQLKIKYALVLQNENIPMPKTRQMTCLRHFIYPSRLPSVVIVAFVVCHAFCVVRCMSVVSCRVIVSN